MSRGELIVADRRITRLGPLRIPRFRALWLAAFLSWYGDFLSLPALLIIGYQLGGELGVGAVVFLQTAPLLALLPVGGALGDVGDRRRRLVALDMARASLAALMVLGAASGNLALVLIGVMASRSASALYDPGRRRLLPVVLPRAFVPAGGSLLSAVAESSILVAPAIGALLLRVIQPEFLILIDGLTFLASAALLVRVGPQPAVLRRVHLDRNQIWHPLRRGFAILWMDRTTRVYAVQAGLGAMLAAVVTVYFVPLVHDIFHLGTSQVGVMYILVGGASLVGSALSIRRPQVRPHGLITIGYVQIVVAVLIGSTLGVAAVVGALLVFAAAGALQEAWGLNRIQITTQREGIGQALGSALWFQYLGRALGAALGAWGATRLDRQDFLLVLVVAAVGMTLLVSLLGGLRMRRNVGSWPPGGPPLPLEP